MTDLRKIAAAMGGEVNGNVARFPTPGHSKADRGSWASIVPGAPDGVLINSRNGGDPLAIKDQLRAKGVLPTRERERTLRTRDVGAWEYIDAAGVVLYRKVRMALSNGGKSYRFEHPDGRGGWRPKRGDAPQVPYRLPDILAAEHAAILYMAEGEKQADKLASWGYLATSSKDWRKQFDNYVAGRTVVILPDNDPEGERVAAEAKASVERVGGKAIILTLPGLPPKGDVMDWTGDADELRALTEAALSPPAPMLPLLDPGAWQGQHAPAREWALHEWIPARQATYLTGAGSAGKSLAAQQLATCIALGRPFLGIETRQAVAIYVTCEDDADELHRRQANICDALGVPLAALSGKLHLVSLAGAIGNELATFDPLGRMATSPAWETLRATVLATGAGFVALDNVAHLFAGNENIRNQVAAFCGLLNNLAAEADASVLFIGHPNKAGDSFSGSTAWENQVRSRIFLDRPRDADGSVLDPDARTLSRAKANYARNGEALSFRWHKWAFVREDDLPPNAAKEMAETIAANHDNAVFLACLDERNRQERPVSESKASRTYAPKEFAEMAESKRIGRARLEAAMDRLFRIRAIERGVVGRHRAEGKDMIGLRRASDDLSDDVPMTPSDDIPMTARRPPMAHTPSTTYYPGGAPEVGAPSHDEDDIDWGDQGGEP